MEKINIYLIILIGLINGLHAQPHDSIEYNGQYLFLNGSNVAWVNFAGDIGPGATNFREFGKIFREAHDFGANSMRLWLHTTGEVSPAFSGDTVTGPGEGTIEDLRQILDSAYRYDIGLVLCLWSFDMLGIERTVKDRNKRLLTTDTLISLYIENALIPMVDSLKDHPGIIAWEIFNEPEGMCSDVTYGGWSHVIHVSIRDVQKFINRCAGAIHRTHPEAKVTNGAWAFISATDAGGNTNYYTDARLIEKGGDAEGTLDFYTVHYYDWAGPALSPFLHPATYWELDKPLVVAEFFPDCDNCGEGFGYENLYKLGYAGAMGWQWIDNKEAISKEMQNMLKQYTRAVDINNNIGNTPSLTIISPENNARLPSRSSVEFNIEAVDTDGQVEKVEIWNKEKVLATLTSSPYIYVWEEPDDGEYVFFFSVTDNDGYNMSSGNLNLIVGDPPVYKYEAEDAMLSGSAVVKNQAEASGGKCAEFGQPGSMLWTIPNVPVSGSYPVVFSYRLPYGSPKTQYIIINDNTGEQMEREYKGELNTWLLDTIEIAMDEGTNTIEIEAYWGWMQFDFLELPFPGPVMIKEIVVTAEDNMTTITAPGATLQLYAQIEPNDAFDKTVTWSVNIPSRASISENGLLTARTNGIVDAIATANDGSAVKGKISITISGQTPVNGIVADSENLIYPDPADDYFYISTARVFEKAEIITVSGNVIRQYRLQGTRNRIPVQDVPGGIYFVRLSTGDGHCIFAKMMIR
jgi:hypothetical protein